MAEANIEGLVKELKAEGVTKKDFESLGNIQGLSSEQIKEKIAKFDEKEGLSPAEQKLYELLIKINGIQTLAKVTEAFNKKNKLKKILGIAKNKILKGKAKLQKIHNKIMNKKQKILKLKNEIIKKAEKTVQKQEEAKSIEEQIKDKKNEINQINKNTKLTKEQKTKKVNIILNEIKKLGEISKKVKKEVIKNQKEVEKKKTEAEKTTKDISKTEGEIKQIKDEISNQGEKLLDAQIKSEELGDNNLKKEAQKIENERTKVIQTNQKITTNIKEIKEDKETVKDVTKVQKKETEKTIKTSDKNIAEVNSIEKQLESLKNYFGNSNAYNNLEINYFIKNIDNIKFITDKKQLGKLLENKSIIDKIKNEHPSNVLNSKLLNDIDILLKYQNLTGISLNSKDIKDLDLYIGTNLKVDLIEKGIMGNKIKVLKNLKDITLKNFLIEKYPDKSSINTIKNIINNKSKNHVFEEAIKIVENTNTVAKVEEENIYGKKEKDKLNFQYKVEVDNTLVKILNTTGGINKIIQKFSKNIDRLYYFPKLKKAILSKKEYITNFLQNNPDFYDKFLNIKKKHEFSIIYTNILSTKYKSKFKTYFEKISIGTMKNAIEIFKIIKGHFGNKSKILFKELLNNRKYKNIQAELNFIMSNNKEKLNQIKKGANNIENNIITIMQSSVKNLSAEYQNIYDKKTKDISDLTINTKKISEKPEYIIYKTQIESLITAIKNGKKENVKIAISKLANVMGSEKIKKFEQLLGEIFDNSKKENKAKAKTFIENLKENNKKDYEYVITQNILDKNGKVTEKELKEFQKFYNKNAKKFKGDEEKALQTFLEQNQYKNLKPEVLEQIKKQIISNNPVKILEKTIDRLKKAKTPEDKKKIYEQIKNPNSSFFKNIDKEIQQDIIREIKEYEKIYGEIEEPQIGDKPLSAYTVDESGKVILDPQYQLNIVDYEDKTITLKDHTTINLTDEEFEELNIKNLKIGNIEAYKNIIDMKEKLEKLGLDFVWQYRKSIFKVMKNNSEFKISGINENDSNLVDKREFNVLLQFILKIYGDKNPSTVESINYARILQINEIGAINNKRHFNSGLSNIGQKFIEIGYFNSTGGIDIFGEDKLRKYIENGYKIIT